MPNRRFRLIFVQPYVFVDVQCVPWRWMVGFLWTYGKSFGGEWVKRALQPLSSHFYSFIHSFVFYSHLQQPPSRGQRPYRNLPRKLQENTQVAEQNPRWTANTRIPSLPSQLPPGSSTEGWSWRPWNQWRPTSAAPVTGEILLSNLSKYFYVTFSP